jgi:hypothetical protein
MTNQTVMGDALSPPKGASDRAEGPGRAAVQTVMRRPTSILLSSSHNGEARTTRPRGNGAGHRAPASDRAGVWGGAPR